MKFKNSFFLLCSIVLMGCNKANFSIGSQPPPVPPKTANDPPPASPAAPSSPKPPPVEAVIKKLSPSFVTRASGCIMCHADIKGGFFLDFGYDGPSESNKAFLGGANDILSPNGAPPSSIFYGRGRDSTIYLGLTRYFTWFRDPAEPGWMAFRNTTPKSKVQGVLYVPDVTLTKDEYSKLFSTYINPANTANPTKTNMSSITLADLINTPLQVPAVLNGGTVVQQGNAMSAIITPPNPGDAPVVALKELKIGAPTSADIRSLLNGKNCPPEGCLVALGNHVAVGGFKGINQIPRTLTPPAISPRVSVSTSCSSSDASMNAYSNMVNTAGVSASQVFCSGDVVVVGSLFLKNLNIKTDDTGCRFYVDGNVWIDGNQVTYVDDVSGKSHLQITATGSIIFGVYNSPTDNPNNSRDLTEGYLVRRVTPDDDKASMMILRSTIVADNRDRNLEASKSFLKSILCDGTYAPDNFFTNPPAPPGIKNIKKVILNAPLIQGYFKATTDLVADPRLMTGIVISETSLFGGNNFSFKFEYAPVFSNNSSFLFFPAFSPDVRNRIFTAIEK